MGIQCWVNGIRSGRKVSRITFFFTIELYIFLPPPQSRRHSGKERARRASAAVPRHHRHPAVVPAAQEVGAHVEVDDTRWGEWFYISTHQIQSILSWLVHINSGGDKHKTVRFVTYIHGLPLSLSTMWIMLSWVTSGQFCWKLQTVLNSIWNYCGRLKNKNLPTE